MITYENIFVYTTICAYIELLSTYLFNSDSFNAMLNNHYKAWSYKKKMKSKSKSSLERPQIWKVYINSKPEAI